MNDVSNRFFINVEHLAGNSIGISAINENEKDIDSSEGIFISIFANDKFVKMGLMEREEFKDLVSDIDDLKRKFMVKMGFARPSLVDFYNEKLAGKTIVL